jgi:DNA-directed RNA polymerase subunit E'/Rpb7
MEILQQKKMEQKKITIKPKKKLYTLFMKNVITRKAIIPFTDVGANIKELLELLMKQKLEGKCVVEGYIKPNSIKVMNFSSGVIKSKNIEFDVMLECLICNPPVGMTFMAKVVNITKAGLRCISEKDEISPVDVFLAKDHNYNNKLFNSVKLNDIIKVRVLGQRYEINDEKISVIADIIEKKMVTIIAK